MQSATAQTPPAGGRPLGVRQSVIEGRFRSIPTHQLVLAWWLHTEGHITRRQLRVWFAAHEMHERRRYTMQERGRRRQSCFEIEELKGLVGGRGSASADDELAADIRQLSRIGLVKITRNAVTFASSADQIAVDDLTGFWAMFDRIPNQGRAVTGVMLALMIRSLFWHRERNDYRVDGRTKGSWIADVFGISRRGVTDARAHLIELGWLEPIAARQWELNRWGAHDRINVEWTPGQTDSGAGEGGEIASPSRDCQAETASPDLNQSPSLREDLKTNRPGHRPGLAGVCSTEFSGKKIKRPVKAGPPTLRRIDPQHLQSTDDLLDLFDQAIKAGLVKNCEAGRLDFIALAERARARGRNPGGMFRWLLTHKRFDFITQGDEDAAVRRLRAWRDGEASRSHARGTSAPAPQPKARALTDDEKIVRACLRVGGERRMDPFLVARAFSPDWTRDRWDTALVTYETGELERRAAVVAVRYK